MKKLINKMTGMPKSHLSFSQISSLAWSAEQYKQTYIWQKTQSSIYLDFGKTFHEALQYRKKVVPDYLEIIRRQIPITKQSEVEMRAEIDKIPVLGFFDGMNDNKIIEYKTGKLPNFKSWKSQLSLYSLLYFQNYGKLPKSVKLYWARTEINSEKQLIFANDKVKVFDIDIQIKDILKMTTTIIKAYEEIKALCETEREMFGKLPCDK